MTRDQCVISICVVHRGQSGKLASSSSYLEHAGGLDNSTSTGREAPAVRCMVGGGWTGIIQVNNKGLEHVKRWHPQEPQERPVSESEV